MPAIARLVLSALIALALGACSREAPPAAAPAAASGDGAGAPAATPAAADAARLGDAALRERAAASLAANRLYAPAGDNAVEDYLALRERLPGDAAVETALVDLAPYVMIGAEQATAAGDFVEAARLVDLLATMDEAAPAVPRLREALATARTQAEAAEAAELAAAAAAAAAAEAAARTEAERLATASAARTARPAAVAEAPRAAPPTTSAPPPAPRPTTAAPALATRPASPTASAPGVAASAAPAASPPTSSGPRAVVSQAQPRFPEAAMRRRLEGVVELQVRVRADGSVESVEVVRADPANVFDREAVLAVRRWRYAPAEAPSEERVMLRFRRPS